MNRYKEWRATRAAQRARTMNTAQLTTGFWGLHDRRQWDRLFMTMIVVGGMFFFASSTANDRAIARTNARLERQVAEQRKTIDDILAARREARLNTCRRATSTWHGPLTSRRVGCDRPRHRDTGEARQRRRARRVPR